MSLSKDEVGQLEQLYERKKCLEDGVAYTEHQMMAGEPIIFEVGRASIEESKRQIQILSDEIDELWARGELDGFGCPIQGTFGFYWECQIEKAEYY